MSQRCISVFEGIAAAFKGVTGFLVDGLGHSVAGCGFWLLVIQRRIKKLTTMTGDQQTRTIQLSTKNAF